MNRRKWLGVVLAMVFSLSSLFQGFGTPANAQETGKEVDATITDFHIESPKGTTVTEINTNDSFHLAMDWKVKDQMRSCMREIISTSNYLTTCVFHPNFQKPTLT